MLRAGLSDRCCAWAIGAIPDGGGICSSASGFVSDAVDPLQLLDVLSPLPDILCEKGARGCPRARTDLFLALHWALKPSFQRLPCPRSRLAMGSAL